MTLWQAANTSLQEQLASVVASAEERHEADDFALSNLRQELDTARQVRSVHTPCQRDTSSL